jgi:hypothetical protein
MGVSALARRFRIDVSADAVSWLQLVGVTDFNPQVAPQTQDSSTYDSDGWGSSEITLNKWSVQVKALRQTTGGVFDPGQELVRARVAQFGDAARIYVRWYDNSGAPEAHQGWGIVSWSRSKTGVTDLDEAQITVDGDGSLTDITNPYAPALAPVVAAATPSAAGTGDQVEISGQGFTGTSSVKFAAVAVTQYTVVSDSLIVAVVPTGSAGSAPITVTNATGVSNALAYTRSA